MEKLSQTEDGAPEAGGATVYDVIHPVKIERQLKQSSIKVIEMNV